MVKLEKEALVLCLDESNKLNVILKKHYDYEVEKNKSLEQELVESKVKLEKLSSIKPVVVSELIFELPKPNDDKVYIPPFKRNHKENANFAWLDKGKISCKVVIYNYVLCWLYSMTKSVVIALPLFLVFCGI